MYGALGLLGDANTKYFHGVAMERFHPNNIAQITSTDGTILLDHAEDEAAFRRTFKEQLGQTCNRFMLFDLQQNQ